MAEVLRLQWQKAKDRNGYRFDGRPVGAPDPKKRLEVVIVSRNGRAMDIQVESTALFDFANVSFKSTPVAVLDFHNRWGLLDHRLEYKVEEFLSRSLMVAFFLEMLKQPSRCSPGSFEIMKRHLAGTDRGQHFVFDSGGISIVRKPETLLHFCMLELKRLIEEKAEVSVCPRCDGYYEQNPQQSRRTCSDQCRKAMWKRGRRIRRMFGLNETFAQRVRPSLNSSIAGDTGEIIPFRLQPRAADEIGTVAEIRTSWAEVLLPGCENPIPG